MRAGLTAVLIVLDDDRVLSGRQGQVTGVAFETGPLAMPGVTGDRLPGASRLGPNRWVPHAGAPKAGPAASMDSTAAAPQGAR